MSDLPILRRGEIGYEQARQAAIWNGKKPDRFPEAIVVARDDADVVAAVRLAATEGWTVGVRSGGHGWSAPAVRDGGLLLDLSGFNTWEIDPVARTASAGPGVRSQVFQQALGEHGLYFPTGTCPTVALGGFVLGGGTGFTCTKDGSACYSLTAIDVVTADGELVHADDQSHPDLLWAARGSGPGFFAAVTRLYLKLHPIPAAMFGQLSVYPIDVVDEFLAWALPATLQAPDNVFNGWAAIESALPHYQGITIVHFPVAFADNEDQARAMLKCVDPPPFAHRALVQEPPRPWTWDDGYATINQLYAEGYRYRSDALWIKPDDDAFLAPLAQIIRSLPTNHSHVLWAPFKAHQPAHANAAYSLHTPLSVHVYGVGEQPHEDEPLDMFVRDAMISLEPYSIRGGKINDHDLVSFPKYVLAPEEGERLKKLKAQYDPDDRFHSYLGTPEPVAR